MAIDAMQAGTASGGEQGAGDACTGIDAGGGMDAMSWTDRLVAAASDYEAIDAEALAGLGCTD